MSHADSFPKPRPSSAVAAALLALVGLSRISSAAEPGRPPLDPEASRRAFQVDEGLRVELAAGEPQVESPVAIAFDEEGRLWVVEMRDYPNGPPPGGAPMGRVKVLEDRDGDGAYESARIFAEGILFGNGVMPWKGGVIVTAAPHIVYLKDEDGDGKADRREVLYEGFKAENPQLRVSHPILGLDGWIYVANGLRGGKVTRAGRDGSEVIDLSGRDFRFDLVHDRAEAVAGMGQYGNTFDDWGHRFVCTNRDHLIPIVLEDRYARRNPYLAPPGPRGPDQNPGGAAEVFPLTKQDATSSLHLGQFTAACGVTVYRGTLLPESYRGAAFTCDPTGHLVHQEILEPDGASFRGRVPHPGVEFLASADPWCRPVDLAYGPDGALYVIDMYRAVIEHPEWMPPELRNRPDLWLGQDRGRIWRIVPEGRREPAARPHLAGASTAGLVTLLTNPDGWWRTTAQRLLLERDDPGAVGPLRAMAAEGDPLGRVHAAWLLEGRDALEDQTVLGLIRADHPRVREHGVLLAEARLAGSESLRDAVIATADDPDARVRFQVALSLGEWDDDRTLDPLATVALAGPDDRWTRLAVGSAVPERSGALIRTLIAPPHRLTEQLAPGRLALLRELAEIVGARRDAEEVGRVLETLSSLDAPEAGRWRLSALNGLAEGMGRRGAQLGAFLKQHPGPASERAAALLAGAVAAAEDRDRDPAARLDATRLLAHAPHETAAPTLERLMVEDPAPEVRLAAARSLAAHPEPDVAGRLLGRWRALTPAVRREVAQALLARPERSLALLDAMADGRLSPGDLDANQARRLVNHPRADLRERARSLLAASLPADRKAVLDRYQAALDRPGDPAKGREVFRKSCATCHRIGEIGVAVGPDVGDNRTKTKAMLLADILNPNGAIDANYATYTVATTDGRVLDGILAAETASALTLRRAEGQSDVVLRSDIDEIRASGSSLMPEGLEKDLPVDAMADLLAFLKGWRDMDDTTAPR